MDRVLMRQVAKFILVGLALAPAIFRCRLSTTRQESKQMTASNFTRWQKVSILRSPNDPRWFGHASSDVGVFRAKTESGQMLVEIGDVIHIFDPEEVLEIPEPPTPLNPVLTERRLDSLPEGSIILDGDETAHQKYNNKWWQAGWDGSSSSEQVSRFAVKVVYIGEGK